MQARPDAPGDWTVVGFWNLVGTFWPAVFLMVFVVVLFYRLRRGMPPA